MRATRVKWELERPNNVLSAAMGLKHAPNVSEFRELRTPTVLVEMRRFSGHWAAMLALLGTLSVPGAGLAQTTEATRAAARQLATEGVNNFEEGDFAAASEKLNRAFETLRAPSLGLWSARALARCGRLVQASERYLEVQRLDPKNGDEAVQRQAQADAASEHLELQARLARVTLALFGAIPEQELRVTLDGAPLPAGLVRAQVPMDPGPHVIEALQGERKAAQAFTVKEGARINVSLQLLPADTQSPSQGGQPVVSATTPNDKVAAPNTSVALWLSLAGAGAGIVVGSVTGVMAMKTREPVAPHCPGDVCDPAYAHDVRRLNTLRYVSTASFGVGAAGLIAASALWLTAPRPHSAQPYVRPRLGLSNIAVEGAF